MSSVSFRTDTIYKKRHCKERSDEAIQVIINDIWIVSCLAMTMR
jgi:hypothetical protein